MDTYSILVADDDRDCREALRDTLSREGYLIVTASCGEEAVEIVHRRGREFHATILDMFMPGLTGLETLEAIVRVYSALPTIFLTADASKELLMKAMEAGAYTLLRKPVSGSLIVVTLNQLLGKYYGDSGMGDSGIDCAGPEARD